MKFWNRHWYEAGLCPAIIAFVILIANWGDMSVLLRLNTISFIAMLLHQFEEYRFPGGEPAIMNIVLQESDQPDRFPLNQFSAMFTNCLFSYVIYLLPIIFPNTIWLGIAPILMGMMQFIVHGIMTNKKLKSIYNPGLGAVVLLHIPVGILYIRHITVNHLAGAGTWLIGIFYTMAATGLILGYITYFGLSDRNTKWIFAPVEMERFHVNEKLKRKGIEIHPGANGTMVSKNDKMKSRKNKNADKA